MTDAPATFDWQHQTRRRDTMFGTGRMLHSLFSAPILAGAGWLLDWQFQTGPIVYAGLAAVWLLKFFQVLIINPNAVVSRLMLSPTMLAISDAQNRAAGQARVIYLSEIERVETFSIFLTFHLTDGRKDYAVCGPDAMRARDEIMRRMAAMEAEK